jgi:hypothetical protein
MDQATAAITASCITAFVTLLSAVVTKYGWTFWRVRRELSFAGPLVVVARFEGALIEQVPDDPPLEQELQNGKVLIRGRHCSLSADYLSRRGGKTLISGRMKATGEFHHGVSHMTYKIAEASERHEAYGVILLYIPDWGELSAYILNESVIRRGKTGLIFGRLSR